jgi:nitrogen fixation protein FixH
MSIQSQSSGPVTAGGGKKQRAPGWWYPYIYVAAFLLVVAVNGLMIYFAMSTYNGLETENHFIKGIKYNSALEGARQQQARGWTVRLDFQAPGQRAGRVALNMRDKDGNLLREAQVTVRAVRPVAAGHDFDIEMSYLGEGRWGGEGTFPLAGVWDLKLKVDHASGDYQEVKRIWVD